MLCAIVASAAPLQRSVSAQSVPQVACYGRLHSTRPSDSWRVVVVVVIVVIVVVVIVVIVVVVIVVVVIVASVDQDFQ